MSNRIDSRTFHFKVGVARQGRRAKDGFLIGSLLTGTRETRVTMPVDWSKYPANWDEIAGEVKDQAGWKCEQCGKQCRLPGESFDTHKRTLTVAHINHVEMDCAPENLVALCPKCHLAYDETRKKLQRLARKRIKRTAKSTLF